METQPHRVDSRARQGGTPVAAAGVVIATEQTITASDEFGGATPTLGGNGSGAAVVTLTTGAA